ncbi:MAG: B12-binding domain-containing radical SAM protein [Acidobacteriota bacterium]|nr:B12-binding domain-containing radical SAM protein [Acidobacteriota bacterium]
MRPSALLVGPYDPYSGEYTFLAPPLGVWRLKGVLQSRGFEVAVFDPNCVESGTPERAFEQVLAQRVWSVIGFSTTGMTLKWDLSLAHLAHARRPESLLVAGGMEATFNVNAMFNLGPFDIVVLGEGERPLIEILTRVGKAAPVEDIIGTAWRSSDGAIQVQMQPALTHDELRDSIFRIPYEEMPYAKYWERLEEAYNVGALPFKADREARLSEIRSVRLITLNYCPMGCTFCSSTHFLNAAQGSTARIARLDEHECMTMIQRIIAAHPTVRTIIFQDDIFVFRTDARVLPLMKLIIDAKERGELPPNLQFISTNRIDAMTRERLEAMRLAGFRVLGFGIESFSPGMLEEFNKSQIYGHIDSALRDARALGITPFLDTILTSPRCSLFDVAETIRQAYAWIAAGCEVGMYPYVIPFSGAAMSTDPRLRSQIVTTSQQVPGTAIRWDQPSKILPFDPAVRDAIVEIEELFRDRMEVLERDVPHLPSRVRSLLWIASAIPILARAGHTVPVESEAIDHLMAHLPALTTQQQKALRDEFEETALERASGR